MNLTLQNLKLFLRVDRLFLLQSFFMDGLPSYDGCLEKPALFDSDRGNDPKFAFLVHLSESLVCFEQLSRPLTSGARPKEQISNDYFSRTIAFQGQVYFKYIFEKVNRIKEELVHLAHHGFEKLFPDFRTTLPEGSVTKADGLHQHPLFSILLKVNGLQPFLCDIADLNKPGLQLELLHRRQIIVPFNLKFESHDMIQCVKSKVIAIFQEHDRKVKSLRTQLSKLFFEQKVNPVSKQELLADDNFRFYSSQQLEVELAEVHLSFNDLIIVQGILARMGQLVEQHSHRQAFLAEHKDDEEHNWE